MQVLRLLDSPKITGLEELINKTLGILVYSVTPGLESTTMRFVMFLYIYYYYFLMWSQWLSLLHGTDQILHCL